MTGYASTQAAGDGVRVACEIRSVNSRFLDLTFRIGDDARAVEAALRELITSRIARGKVECRVAVQRADATATGDPDPQVLQRLSMWQLHVRTFLPEAQPLSVAEALRWPGVFAESSLEGDALRDTILAAARACLDEFDASRLREGARLADALRDRATRLGEIAAGLRKNLPALRDAHRERVTARLAEAVGQLPEGATSMTRDEIATRIANEVAMFAMRADVDEELTRLDSHVTEVRRVLDAGAPAGVGKRLDFLMQELHREANTLGSKALAAELADASIEMKLLIEQMREQVQNIE